MLPSVYAVETYANSRSSDSVSMPALQINGTASENFQLFVNTTPAFVTGVSAAGSVGTYTVTGQIRPKITGVQASFASGDLSAEVYFGNSITLIGVGGEFTTVPLFAEGQIVDNQAYPMGLLLEMRTSTLDVYIDQWIPVEPTLRDAWEEVDRLQAYCEV